MLGSSAALAAPPKGLDARIEGSAREFGLPGMAVAIVEDGEIELARGYGVRKWYGPISIDARNGELVLDFKQTPGMTGELEHWQYDTFRKRWDDRTIEPQYVTFALTAEGTIDQTP